MKRSFAACVLAALVSTAASGANIVRLQNNYSYILPGMPNSAIAQGSIFDIFGNGLSTGTSTLQSVPLPTVLSGASVSITANGVTTQAPLYFVSPGQIAAILPSATPTGTGQITLSINGQIATSAPITVVQTAFGMLSLNGAGNGPAAVYDINSHYLGLTNAANPGDFITLWGSGLGPVTGDETIAQTPVDLTDIPIEVDIGGKPATVQYHGRSIYPGLDQINVMVSAGLYGCHVSVVVRAGDIVSNFGTIPIASSGRVCSEPVIGLTAGQIQTWMSQPGVTRGVIDFDDNSPVSPSDTADVTFVRFTNAQYAAKQPTAGGVPFGDCTVDNFINVNMGIPNPIQGTLLNAGPAINLLTPSGSGFGNVSLPFQDGSYAIDGLKLNGHLAGTYTFAGSGGPDVGAFSAQITFPGGAGGFNYSTPGNPTSVTRSQGLTVTWNQPSSTDPSEYVQLSGFAYVYNQPMGADFYCNVQLAAGRFTVPPAVLLALPTSSQSVLDVALVISKSFAAPGVDQGIINFFAEAGEPFVFQ